MVFSLSAPSALRLPRGFREVEERRVATFEMTRFRTERPLPVSRRALATTDFGGACKPEREVKGCEQAAVVLQRPGG